MYYEIGIEILCSGDRKLGVKLDFFVMKYVTYFRKRKALVAEVIMSYNNVN